MDSDFIVIEVGSNIGAHTLPMAKLVGKKGHIYAFEPTNYATKKLNENLALNPLLKQNIHVIKKLVSNHDFEKDVVMIQSQWLVDKINRGDVKTKIKEDLTEVDTTSLDKFFYESNINRLDLLKIDVDGYDFKVLQGATEMIKQEMPTIFIELSENSLSSQGDCVDDIVSMLIDLGYQGILETGEKISKDNSNIQFNTTLNSIFTPLPKK